MLQLPAQWSVVGNSNKGSLKVFVKDIWRAREDYLIRVFPAAPDSDKKRAFRKYQKVRTSMCFHVAPWCASFAGSP